MKELPIEKYFTSNAFAKLLSNFDKDSTSLLTSTGILMEYAMEYVKVNSYLTQKKNNTEGLNDYLISVVKYYKKNEINSIEDCIINNISIELLKKKIKEYAQTNNLQLDIEDVLEHSLSNITKYHATNMAFIDSIKEEGLTKNGVAKDFSEIDYIESIFKKYNPNSVFTYKSSENSVNNVVRYSTTTHQSYYYFTCAPEWFSQFVGSQNFITKNYDAAKQKVVSLIKTNNLNEADSEIVLSFFEKHWNKLAKNSGVIIAMDLTDEEIERNANFARTARSFGGISRFVSSEKDRNLISDNDLSVDNATFIEMPNYNELVKKVNHFKYIAKNKTKTAKQEKTKQKLSSKEQSSTSETEV